MTTAVIVIWWIALGLALLLTLVAWELLNRVLLTAKRIESHAARTLPAAQNIARHTAAVSQLKTINGVAGEVLATAQAMAEKTSALSKKLS